MKTINLCFRIHQRIDLKPYRFFEIGNDHYYYDDFFRLGVFANNLMLNGNIEPSEVINYTKAGGACAACHEKIEWVLEECLGAPLAEPEAPAPAANTASTIVGRIRLIEQALDQVRPQLQADGGDVQLSDVEDDMVFISLTGACSGCGLSAATIAMIEQKISQVLGENITVYPTGSASVA